MRKVVLTTFLSIWLPASGACVQPTERPLRIMFWNLENFFDYRADTLGSGYDTVFTARGERHWTKKRFMAKCESVAKALLWCSSDSVGLPDAVGFAEVENRFVIDRLLRNTILDKLDYKVIHFDSPDRRGIDVALIYRQSAMKLLFARPVGVTASRGQDTLRTRDILVADFLLPGGDTLTLSVNHHPSKFGGGNSAWRRQAAIDALERVAQSSGEHLFIAMGDFNDTPDNPAYSAFEASSGLVNMALPLHLRGLGTIRYEGRWELIDMFFVSDTAGARMDVLKIPFLMTRDNVHSGEKPFRTYLGPRYIGGVSDHLPIILTINRP